MSRKNIISIETSCDETAIAIINFDENNKNNFDILSNHILSQINLHREFGGVFPALAKREHAKNIVRIFTECLKEANLFKEKNNIEIEEERKEEVKILLERESEMYEELLKLASNIEKPDLENIAVTSGPGLAPALWVGINFAKALSIFWDIKVYPINHMEGHTVSSLISPISEKEVSIKNFDKPALVLLISGGHTEINYLEEIGKYKKLGGTVDDAVGEAFDKVARSLGLPYPGGPEISKIAESCRENNFQIIKEFKLPRPMINSQDLNFSFSGLKTAVIYKIKEMREKNIDEENIKKQICLDFENSVTEILLKKIKKAIEENRANSLLIGGGVIANNHIRKSFIEFAENENINLFIPEKNLTGDNALMIATAGFLQITNNKKDTDIKDIKADSNWSLE